MSENTNNENDSQHAMDENLYSRQLYVLGHEAMRKMQQSNVLIVGLDGLGVEIAKNVILTGVKSVTLYDDKNVEWRDLSSQFYFNDSMIGQNRLTCIDKLKELNPYVSVQQLTGKLEDSIQNYNVVVFCNYPIKNLVSLNHVARKNGVKFISAETRGVFGNVFCDFGEGFEVYDPDGETTMTNIVTNITNENPGTVTVHDDKPKHGLYDGDLVRFEEVQGMSELNNMEPMEVKVTGRHEFTICDTTKLSAYKSGGSAIQVKKVKKIDFLSLDKALKNPKTLETDFAKLERPLELHAVFQAYSDFIEQNNREPRSYNKEDADELVNLTKNIEENVNEDVIRKFSYTCVGNLNPMCAFIGGVASQEVQKALSGKFHPIEQFLYFDAVEVIPTELPSEEDCKPQNSRYDGQIAVFGKKIQDKILNSNVFVVGAGALGSEYMKNFAMIGAGCGKNGVVNVTDMDSIEVSNLNRQFLFRKKHVGKMKSIVAAEIAKEMNPDMNVKALSDKVAPETEVVFDEEFWEKLSVVTNALDNVQARLYVDSRCVYYRKPLIEAGTLGTKGNTQVVIPFKTESYGSSPDPPEKEIPICTLKNFPNKIDHTIQWGRDMFEGLFKKVPEDVNSYLTNPNYLEEVEKEGGSGKKTAVENIYDSLLKHKPVSFGECVEWARLRFEQLYSNNIKQLLYNFPTDMITSSGAPFWGGPKRPPTPLSFDSKDKTHMDFIVAASNLRAVVYGLKGLGRSFDYEQVLSKMNVPKFVPKKGVKIETDEKKTEEDSEKVTMEEDEEEQVNRIVKELPKPSSLAGFKLNVVEFEKDDDANYHIEFVTATSNLRARNYKIKEANKHETKGIAGRIIPAMVTTTALITGLGALEYYKLIQNKDNTEDYKNAFVNIGIPFFTLSEPLPPATQEAGGKSFSLWDRYEISEGRDITMEEFLNVFKKKYGYEISMMSCGSAVMYSFFGNKKKIEERKKTPMSQVYKSIVKKDFLPKQKYMNVEVCCTDEDDEDIDVPYIRYQFRHF